MRSGYLRGFTLVELLVAVAIFSIMSVMAYGGLSSLMSGRQHTDQVAKHFREVQRIFLFLQQDLSQIVPRPIRDEFGETENAVNLDGPDNLFLQLTRGGIGSTWSGYSSLRRVTYQIKERQLIRSVWPVLDRTQGSEPNHFYLTDSLEHMEIRFLPRGKQNSDDWLSAWPKPDEATAESAVPRAIEVKLQITGLGEITRLFMIAS